MADATFSYTCECCGTTRKISRTGMIQRQKRQTPPMCRKCIDAGRRKPSHVAYVCDVCHSEVSVTREQWANKAAAGRPYKCARCTGNGRKKYHGERAYVCERCGRKRSLSHSGFCTKMRSNRPKVCYACFVASRPVRPRVISFVCLLCGRMIRIKRSAHLRRVREGRSNVCRTCRCGTCNNGHGQGWKGSKHFSGQRLTRMYRGAMSRNLTWSLSSTQLDEMWERQAGLCALSGRPMTLGPKQWNSVSLDRIDSAIGYTPTNVQFVCRVLNFMKSNLAESDFVGYCKMVAEHSHESLSRQPLRTDCLGQN